MQTSNSWPFSNPLKFYKHCCTYHHSIGLFSLVTSYKQPSIVTSYKQCFAVCTSLPCIHLHNLQYMVIKQGDVIKVWDRFFDGKSTFDRLELLVVVEWMTLIFWKTGKKSTWQHHMERFVDLIPVFNKWVNNCFINTSIAQAGFSSWLQIWIFRKCPDFPLHYYPRAMIHFFGSVFCGLTFSLGEQVTTCLIPKTCCEPSLHEAVDQRLRIHFLKI